MRQNYTLALVTDLYYVANGRNYFEEDLFLSNYLRQYFKVVLVHPNDFDTVLTYVDVMLLRNTGPKSTHLEALKTLQSDPPACLYSNLAGRGDLMGKQHLVDLYDVGYPVLPTVDKLEDLYKLPTPTGLYVTKPKDGCDSMGLQVHTLERLTASKTQNCVLQPNVEFEYEVSFYLLDNQYMYALYAPDPSKRWLLKPYEPTDQDLDFVTKMSNWNTCPRGIQRVDACRTLTGELLLMELEDYNPYLSLSCLHQDTRDKFLLSLVRSLTSFVEGRHAKA